MKRNLVLSIAAAALAIVPAAFAETSILSITVGPEASFASIGHVTLTNSTPFADYRGSTTYSYKIRTTEASGSGSITVVVTAFTGTSAVVPQVADLKFGCVDAATTGECNGQGNQAVTTGTKTVTTFPAGFHSSESGNTATVDWKLHDNTAVRTGSYSSTATFTISAA